MANQLRELLEKRNKAIADCRAIHDKAKAENRDLSSEEQSHYDTLWGDATRFKNEYDRELRLQEATPEDRADLNKKGETKAKVGLDSEEYRSAFESYLQEGRGGIMPEHRAALQQGLGPEGGYLVSPQEVVNTLLQKVDDLVYMRQWATKYQITGAKSLGIPSYDTDLNDAEWTTELGTGSDDEAMRFGGRELKPNPLAKRVKVSRTLLRNSGINLSSFILDRLAYKFGITEEKHFLTGDGASKPLGVFTASSNGISTGRDVVCGTTAEITPDGLIDVKFKLKEQYRLRASTRWFMSETAMKNISKLKDADGDYIWRESMRVGEPDTIFGIRVATSQYAPAVFTTGQYVVILGDFSFYAIADALSLEVQRLEELYAETNQVGFIGRHETDGMPTLEEAFARGKLG